MRKIFLGVMLTLLIPASGWAQTLQEAARDAARKYDARVLSAHTEQQGSRKVHVIKLITREGVVKTVRVVVKDQGG